MKICIIKECPKEQWSRGYCGTHYQRIRSGAIIDVNEKVRPYHKHKQFHHPLYSTWQGMKNRCMNPKSDTYGYYGGRGIKVCERWLDFANFLEDVGDKPTLKHSLDRIDNDGDYEPGNVKWATQIEQVANQRPKSKYEKRTIT